MEEKKQIPKLENTIWGKSIPWFLSIACIAILAVIGDFLIGNIEWYKDTVFDIKLINAQEPVYRIHAYHIHMSMIKNSVGLFSGFAIMFLGLGVAFYSLKKPTDLDLKSSVWSVNITTASPGIIAIVVGGIIIIYSIGNKSNFASFPVIFEDPPKVIHNDSTIHKNKTVVIKSPFTNKKEDTITVLKSPFSTD